MEVTYLRVSYFLFLHLVSPCLLIFELRFVVPACVSWFIPFIVVGVEVDLVVCCGVLLRVVGDEVMFFFPFLVVTYFSGFTYVVVPTVPAAALFGVPSQRVIGGAAAVAPFDYKDAQLFEVRRTI